MGKRLTLLLLITFLFSYPVKAQEENGHIFSPSGCEFEATLPAKPLIKKRCPSDANRACYDVARYVNVFDLTATVSFEISCNLISQKTRESYTKENLETILRGKAKRNGLVDLPKTFYKEIEGTKISAINGLKKAGVTSKLFVSQIWVGENSLLVVDGEMSSVPNDKADQMFAQILSSVRVKDLKKSSDEEKKEESTGSQNQ